MAKDDNKQLILEALWANPDRAFGCAFKPQGQYKANEKCDKYPEKGKIRLKRTASNITLYYNGSDREGVGGVDIFTWLERYELNTHGFSDTIQALAKIYGIDLKFTDAEITKLNRLALAREVTPLLIDQLTKNPNGQANQYLYFNRQLKNDCIHFGELTEIGIKEIEAELKRKGFKYNLDDLKALGLTYQYAKSGYNLVLPNYCNGVVNGFIFRNILPNVEPKDRYRYSADLNRGCYCDRLTIGDEIILVEGQFDAIRLIQSGIHNVVAFGGAQIDAQITKVLKAHAVKQVTYVPDLEFDQNKQRKTTLVNNAIRSIQNAQIDGEKVINSIYVADLPTPTDLELFENAKGEYKLDADEFGKLYDKEKLSQVLNNRIAVWAYECNQLLEWGKAETNRNGVVNIGEFQNKFDDIYNRTASEYERQRLKDYIANNPIFATFGITASALANKDEWNKGRLYNEGIKALTQELTNAVKDQANPVVINQILAKFNELQGSDTRAEWETQLNETFEDELQAIKDQPETLKTKWELGNIIPQKTGQDKHFIRYCNIEYWPADIEVFCAPTSHGKTMILFQSALDLIKATGKIFLYVSCEENKRQLVERALNVFIDIPNTESGKDEFGKYCFITGTRKKTIKAILRGEGNVFEYTPEHYTALTARVKEWVGLYGKDIRPRLKMIHTEGTTESICGNVLHYVQQFKDQGGDVGGVFVDYMQLLTTDGKSFSRHDELKDVCKGLKTLASQTELPIIIGAQLNRDVMRKETGIDNITVANIGEGADIERIAHDIFLLWQVDKTPLQHYTKTETKNGETKTTISPTGIRSNRLFTYDRLTPAERELKTGYMYVEQMKARDGKTDGWGLLEFDGERGFIGNNNTAKMIE